MKTAQKRMVTASIAIYSRIADLGWIHAEIGLAIGKSQDIVNYQ